MMNFLLFIEMQIDLVDRVPRKVAILGEHFIDGPSLLDDLLLVIFVIDLSGACVQVLSVPIYSLPSDHHVHLNFGRNIKSVIYLSPCSWCHRMLRNLLLGAVEAIPSSSDRYTHLRALDLLLLVLHAICTLVEATLPLRPILLCGVASYHLYCPTVVISYSTCVTNLFGCSICRPHMILVSCVGAYALSRVYGWRVEMTSCHAMTSVMN